MYACSKISSPKIDSSKIDGSKIGDDHWYMQQALKQAQLAARHGEVPVGAIVVDCAGNIVARAYNQTIKRNSPLAHAESLAIAKVARKQGDWRLVGYTLYVTIEPCSLCMNLIIMSRISQLVYGASSPQYGFSLDKYCVFDLYKIPLAIASGVEAQSALKYLRQFFEQRRSARHDAKKNQKSRTGKSEKPAADT